MAWQDAVLPVWDVKTDAVMPIFMAVYKLALRRAPVPSRLLAMCRKKIFITSPSLKKKEGICKRYFVILGTVEIYQQQKVNFLLVSY